MLTYADVFFFLPALDCTVGTDQHQPRRTRRHVLLLHPRRTEDTRLVVFLLVYEALSC